VCRSSGFVIPKRIKQLRPCWLKQWEALYNHYVEHQGQPDILHAHSFVGGYIAKHLIQKYNVPYIITEHYSGFIQHRIPKHWKADLYPIYDNAEKVIAVSSHLKQKLENYTDTAIEVIPNMVDTSVFYPAKQKVHPPPIRLITVGSLIDRKNISFLLRVLSQLEIEATLTIVGEGPLRSKLKREARQLGIYQQVTFTGSLPPEKVADTMRQSHIFVFSSKAETFGVVLIEALACGLLIVTTPCGISEELAKTGNVFITNSEVEMTRAVHQLYDKIHDLSPQLMYQTVGSHFSSNVISHHIRSIYEQVID